MPPMKSIRRVNSIRQVSSIRQVNSTRKSIVLLTSGTRGDVLPYIALGKGLQETGYQVRVALHRGHEGMAEAGGLAYAVLEGNPSELLMQPEHSAALAASGDWLRTLFASLRFLRMARPLYERMLVSAWQACQGADAVAVGLPTTWGAHIAEALGIPCLWCFLQPFSRTRRFPSALLPARRSLGTGYNWLTHRISEQVLWQPWRVLINRWRHDTLHLPVAPLSGPFDRMYGGGETAVYGFSPRVVPRPPDWPENHVITGYWFIDGLHSWIPPAALVPFIEAGSPPLYVGFGSPGLRQTLESLEVIQQALGTSGLRAVMSLPEAVIRQVTLPDCIFPVAEVPHTWLFPRLAGTVHHGGAGTTAASLRAGLPTLVAPRAVDQFFWGERVAALGVGPDPIPQHALRAGRLAQALRRLVDDPGLRQRARVLGAELEGEDGVRLAVEVIRGIL